MFATLRRLGWTAPTPADLCTDKGKVFNLEVDAPKDVQRAARDAATRQTWAR